MIRSFIGSICFFLLVAATSNPTNVVINITAAGSAYPLKVSNGVLENASGQPFMILGDAPQAANTLPLCSAGNTYSACQNSTDTLPTNATFVAYVKDRQTQGFNSIWINILCEAYTACSNNGATQEATYPFTAQLSGTGFPGGSHFTTDSCPENGSTSATPNDMDCWDMSTAGSGASAAYWTHIDGYFKIAAQYGMLVFANPLPVDNCQNQSTGGGIGFMYFNNSRLKSVNINGFADFLYNRYGNPSSSNYTPNLIWWVGNDYGCWDTVAFPNGVLPGADNVVYAFASRLHSDDPNHLITSELDQLSASLTDTVNTWQNVIGLNGTDSSASPMYDVTLLATGESTALGVTTPPMVVEGSYQGEDNSSKDDGTATGTNISGCGYNQIQADPNACPFGERAQFWNSILAGGSGGYVDGNHYSWQFISGWNNGSGTSCTGTSGTDHSPCLDTIGNANLKNAVAFLQANITWYRLVPDLTRSTNANGLGIGVAVSNPLLTGCYPSTSCTNYYVGSARSLPNDDRKGTLQNIMPISGKTSDGKSGIVYVPGISTSCAFYPNFNSFTNCVLASGLQITVNNAVVNGGSNLTATWYDPSGSMTSPTLTICSPRGPTCNSGSQIYTTPSSGHIDIVAKDWVLLITGP